MCKAHSQKCATMPTNIHILWVVFANQSTLFVSTNTNSQAKFDSLQAVVLVFPSLPTLPAAGGCPGVTLPAAPYPGGWAGLTFPAAHIRAAGWV